MRGLNSAQYVWQCVYSIVHFAKFGRDPKRLQHQYFPVTDGEKKKKTDTKTRASSWQRGNRKKWQGFQGGSAKS